MLPYNRGMSHLDILLPFGLPPPELAPDLLRALKTPSLAMLLARARLRHQAFDGFARALPHETWLALQFGLPDGTRTGGSLPVAHHARQALGLPPAAGVWFILHPVHIVAASDHLVLIDRRHLAITEAESRVLFESAQPLFEEAGKQLIYGAADTWFVRADDWGGLRTSTPDSACGHNIDIWMPQGDGDRNWRKLHNEVQMNWHTHSVNKERLARGLKPINALWLWGGSGATDTQDNPGSNSTSTPPSNPVSKPAASPYAHSFNLPIWLQAPAKHGAITIDDVTAPGSETRLLVLDTLIEAALAADWAEWLTRLHQLEADWFAPLVTALKDGRLERVTLLPSHNVALSEFTITPHSLRKFWVKPALARLLP